MHVVEKWRLNHHVINIAHGGDGGDYFKFTVDAAAGERISRISLRASEVIHAIQFETTTGRTSKFYGGTSLRNIKSRTFCLQCNLLMEWGTESMTVKGFSTFGAGERINRLSISACRDIGAIQFETTTGRTYVPNLRTVVPTAFHIHRVRVTLLFTFAGKGLLLNMRHRN